MGILDFANTDGGMQALGLLGAAGPSMEPSNWASRLASAGQGYQNMKAKALQLQAGNLDLQQHQRNAEAQEQIRQLLSGSDFSINNPESVRQLTAIDPAQAQAMQAAEISRQLKMQESVLNAAKAENYAADAAKTNFDVYKNKRDSAIINMSALATPQDALASLNASIVNGHMSMQDATEVAKRIPTNMKDFQKWKMDSLRGLMSAKDQVGFAMPDANALLSASTSRANNAASIAAENARASQGVTYQQDSEGNFVALPNKMPLNQQVVATPVLGIDGNRLQSPKQQLNADQSKAALFGSRMQNAHNILNSLSSAGVTTSNIGSTGMFSPLVNAAQSGQQQQLDQAKRDFVNAVLRRESGAAISPSEFDSAEKQYFPSIGDSAEVIKQKANARMISIRGLLTEVPEGQRDKVVSRIIGTDSKKSTVQSLPTVNANGWTLHTDAQGNKAYVSQDGKSYQEVK